MTFSDPEKTGQDCAATNPTAGHQADTGAPTPAESGENSLPHKFAGRLKTLPQHFEIEIDQEEDGRFIAEIADVPGVLAYGETPDAAAIAASEILIHVLRAPCQA